MDKNIDSPSKRGGFWKTVPGILTAFATMITAIVGLIVSLNQMGIFQHNVGEPGSKKPPETIQQTPPPRSLKATADDITYSILSGRSELYSQREYLLVLEVKTSCKGNAVNFASELFRLEVDGVKYSSHGDLSNKWVEENSDWKEEVKFVVPNDAHVVNLLVGNVGSERISTIPLPPDVLSKWK